MTTQAALDGMLRHVPPMDIQFDGNCTQAIGIDLPIVVINLPHRTDRWQTLVQRMAAVGITRLIRAPAVLGADLGDEQITALLGAPLDGADRGPRSHLTLTRPAVGCFMSHLAIWRWLLASGLPRVLVFEDDAAPAADFSGARLRQLAGSLAPEAGLVFLGRMIMGGLADRCERADLARLYYFNGTFAYLITPAACMSLIRDLAPPRSHIDHQISQVLIARRHEFAAYYTEPAFFEPDWSLRSDCYVALSDENTADRELGQIVEANRHMLLAEGRPLLPL